MNRFLQAVERSRLEEHEQQVSTARGVELVALSRRGRSFKTGRKPGVVVSYDTKQAIIKEYEKGGGLTELAKKHGVSIHCVRTTLFNSGKKERGVDMRFNSNKNRKAKS